MVHGNSEKLNIAREESTCTRRGGSLERAFHDTQGSCPAHSSFEASLYTPIWGGCERVRMRHQVESQASGSPNAFVSADHTISSESCGTDR
jgi:hypothetical protein